KSADHQSHTAPRATGDSASARDLCGSSTMTSCAGEPVTPPPTDVDFTPPPLVRYHSATPVAPNSNPIPNRRPYSNTLLRNARPRIIVSVSPYKPITILSCGRLHNPQNGNHSPTHVDSPTGGGVVIRRRLTSPRPTAVSSRLIRRLCARDSQ